MQWITTQYYDQALDIYADESTLKNEFGNQLTIVSDNDKIQELLRNLFYDILNIEFNLCMGKKYV